MTVYLTPLFDKVGPYFSRAIHATGSLIFSKDNLLRLAEDTLLYQLYDSAIANMLCLDTLRRGTTLSAYTRISRKGSNTEMPYPSIHGKILLYRDSAPAKTLIFTSLCSFEAYKQDFEFYFPEPEFGLLTVPYLVGLIGMLALAILTPIVKIRFTPEETASKFFIHKESGCLYPHDDIDTSHLGISGSLRQGLNRSLTGRITTHPVKFVLGLAQLTAAVALTSIWLYGTSVPVLSALLAQHRIKTLAALWVSTW